MSDGPTGIVLLNMGGPRDLPEVEPFLHRLFKDKELINLPVQNFLGPFLARKRLQKVRRNYSEIGGGSPILKWTEEQGRGMCQRLDSLSPSTAPHYFYTAFRYAEPLSETALKAMAHKGVERAIAFSQYPQFSCSTTGSSLNELWREVSRLDLQNKFTWSVIDRWPTHRRFVEAMKETVVEGLNLFPVEARDDVVIVFSAHSLPMSVINRGDAYPQEVGATVHEVMKVLEFSHEYLLAYQSDVGPVPWLGPSTEHVIRALGTKNKKHVLVVGIAFTSDHIETLHELDIEYGGLAHESGIINFYRAPALNGLPIFQDALAEIVLEHLESHDACTKQYKLRCPGCKNAQCRKILNPITPNSCKTKSIY